MTKKIEVPPNSIGLGELAYILRIDRMTLQQRINRAIGKDLGERIKTKSQDLNPAAFAKLRELAEKGLGEVQSGRNFPRGIFRVRGRWFFSIDNVKSFLERRAVLAQISAKSAAQNLQFFKDKYGLAA